MNEESFQRGLEIEQGEIDGLIIQNDVAIIVEMKSRQFSSDYREDSSYESFCNWFISDKKSAVRQLDKALQFVLKEYPHVQKIFPIFLSYEYVPSLKCAEIFSFLEDYRNKITALDLLTNERCMPIEIIEISTLEEMRSADKKIDLAQLLEEKHQANLQDTDFHSYFYDYLKLHDIRIMSNKRDVGVKELHEFISKNST